VAGQETEGEQISGDHHHTKALKKRYELNAQEKCVRGCLKTGETLLTYLQEKDEEMCAHTQRRLFLQLHENLGSTLCGTWLCTRDRKSYLFRKNIFL